MTFGCIPGEETFFRNVYKLLPGHYFTYENGRVNVKMYWEPTFDINENQTIESVADKLDGVLEDSVNKTYHRRRAGMFLPFQRRGFQLRGI